MVLPVSAVTKKRRTVRPPEHDEVSLADPGEIGRFDQQEVARFDAEPRELLPPCPHEEAPPRTRQPAIQGVVGFDAVRGEPRSVVGEADE